MEDHVHARWRTRWSTADSFRCPLDPVREAIERPARSVARQAATPRSVSLRDRPHRRTRRRAAAPRPPGRTSGRTAACVRRSPGSARRRQASWQPRLTALGGHGVDGGVAERRRTRAPDRRRRSGRVADRVDCRGRWATRGLAALELTGRRSSPASPAAQPAALRQRRSSRWAQPRDGGGRSGGCGRRPTTSGSERRWVTRVLRLGALPRRAGLASGRPRGWRRAPAVTASPLRRRHGPAVAEPAVVGGRPGGDPALGLPAWLSSCHWRTAGTFAAVAERAGLADDWRLLHEVLSWPAEWTALHGIAELKTPVLKLATATEVEPRTMAGGVGGDRLSGGRSRRCPLPLPGSPAPSADQPGLVPRGPAPSADDRQR